MTLIGSRRTFLASLGIGGIAIGCSHQAHSSAPRKDSDEGEDEVTPAEDLMREHGVVRRVMYLYEDTARRLDEHAEVPLDALAGCAAMIRRVIEDYHEKIEEDFVFPRFEKAGKLVDLVATLRKQHVSGRNLTEQIATL